MNSTTKFGGYKVVVGLSIIMFMHMGALTTVSVFLVPIAEGIGQSVGNVSVMISFATGTAAVCGMTIAGPILAKLGPKNGFYLTTVLLFAHFMGYSYATELWQVYACAALGGFAMTIGTNGASSAFVGMWFVEKREQITSIVLGVYSLGGALFLSATGYLVTLFGYRMAYRIEALALLVVALAANFLLLKTPQQLGQVALGSDKQVSTGTGQATNITQIGATLAEAIKTPSFYLIIAGLAIATSGCTFVNNYRSVFMTTYGLSTVAAANYLSIATLAGSVVVVASGFVLPKLKDKRVYIVVVYGSMAVAGLLMGILGTGGAVAIIIVGLALTSLATPCSSVMAPNIAGIAFGNKDYGKILIYMISGCYVGSCAGPIIASKLMAAGTTIAELYKIGPVVIVVGLALMLAGMAVSPMSKMAKAAK